MSYFLTRKPIPGYWYSSAEGRLLQVRALLVSGGRVTTVVIEDINGVRQYMTLSEFDKHDFIIHSPAKISA